MAAVWQADLEAVQMLYAWREAKTERHVWVWGSPSGTSFSVWLNGELPDGVSTCEDSLLKAATKALRIWESLEKKASDQ